MSSVAASWGSRATGSPSPSIVSAAPRDTALPLQSLENFAMKTLVIVAHPELNTSRINRKWMHRLGVPRSRDVTVHDLYAAYRDRPIDVAREQALLKAHDRVILQFPFFWYSAPPLLKTWIDMVLEHGWAYGPGGHALRGKEFGIAVSTWTSREN